MKHCDTISNGPRQGYDPNGIHHDYCLSNGRGGGRPIGRGAKGVAVPPGSDERPGEWVTTAARTSTATGRGGNELRSSESEPLCVVRVSHRASEVVASAATSTMRSMVRGAGRSSHRRRNEVTSRGVIIPDQPGRRAGRVSHISSISRTVLLLHNNLGDPRSPCLTI